MLLVTGYLRVRVNDIERLRRPFSRQIAVVREFYGCDHYAVGIDLLEPDVLRIAERWRTRAAQSAHLIGDHMVEFNIAMRAANVVATSVDSYENGIVRRLLQIPATSFRPEREEKELVVVMGSVKFESGGLERIMPDIEAQVTATRAEDGCELYAFSRDMMEPDTMHIAERWRDQNALSAHFKTPHMTVCNAALARAAPQSMLVKAYDSQGERVLVER